MHWRIEFGAVAEKNLSKLDAKTARRIFNFLNLRVAHHKDPRSLAQPLKGSSLGDLMRFRVGDYRVIASIEDERLLILVLRIGHRREVYR